MLETVFVRFLEISATTSIIILGLCLLAPYLNKTYAAKWKYWIWLVLAVRLIIPVNISLPTAPVEVNIPNVSINTLDNMMSYVPASDIVTVQPDATTVHSEQILPLTETAQRTITLLDVIAVIWLIGIVAFLVYQMAGYFIFKRKVLRWSRMPQDPRIENAIRLVSSKIGRLKRINPLISDAVSSPLMIGFFRPLLILPCETYSDTDLSFIVQHELLHCRRNDLWYKLLLIIANAVHWYNPVIYLMFHEAGGDLELSCDDFVTNGMSFTERKVYTETILASIQRQKMKKTALSTYFYGGQRTMKNRFINILNTKQKKNGALVLLIVVLVVGILGGLVGCSNTEQDPVTPSAEAPVAVSPGEDITTSTTVTSPELPFKNTTDISSSFTEEEFSDFDDSKETIGLVCADLDNSSYAHSEGTISVSSETAQKIIFQCTWGPASKTVYIGFIDTKSEAVYVFSSVGGALAGTISLDELPDGEYQVVMYSSDNKNVVSVMNYQFQ